MRRLTTLLILCGTLALPTGGEASKASSTTRAICKVFGSYCGQALRVSWCESRYNIWARNGQYLGLFQMGDYARARYGHSNNAWGQARAAYRYFTDSGRDWSPWSCKP
jgi:hypothetical protein